MNAEKLPGKWFEKANWWSRSWHRMNKARRKRLA